MNQNRNLASIIQGCKKMDEKSQHELYLLYYSYGATISMSYAQDKDEAIHILHDAFIKVFCKINTFKMELEFKPWFRRILKNTAINYFNKRKGKSRDVNIEEMQIASNEDVLGKLNYNEILKIAQTLSPAYRNVFNMYAVDGYKHKEIAEKLGITISTSKANLTKAKANLRKIVSKKYEIGYVG